jgi:hypothetical protein
VAHPVARAAGRSLLATVVTIVLVPIVAMVILLVPMGIAAIVPVEDELRIVVWAFGAVVFTFAFAAAAIAFAVLRTNVLDPAFSAIGLRGRSLMPNLREWSGTYGARPAYATYARRGGVLELALEERVGARASFSAQATVGRVRELVGLTPLAAPPDPRLAGLVMAGSDTGWTHAVLAQAGVAEALRLLLEDPSGREIRWVLVRPGCVKITRRWIDPDAAGATLAEQLRALEILASACQRVGPPAARLEEGAIERAFRRSPSGASLALVLGLLAALLVPAVVLVVVLVAVGAH